MALYRQLTIVKGRIWRFPWGHGAYLFNRYNGQAFREWINEVPNNGLIRFRGFLNHERVLVMSPEALREIFVTKIDDFEKPFHGTWLLRQFMGNGLIFAVGEEHKVRERRKPYL